jgi:hypothetical protein
MSASINMDVAETLMRREEHVKDVRPQSVGDGGFEGEPGFHKALARCVL